MATGRAPETCEKVFENKSLRFDALVYNCGAQIVADGKLLQSYLLSESDVKEIYTRLNRKGIFPPSFSVVNGKMYTNIDPSVYPGHTADYMVTNYDFGKCDFGIPRLNVMLNQDGSNLTTMDIEEVLSGRKWKVFYSDGDVFAEILHINSDKSNALRYLCNLWGFYPSDVAAFGDDHLDAEMLQVAGYGVAMKNARDNIRAVADYVTEHDNDGDGVARFIAGYIL